MKIGIGENGLFMNDKKFNPYNFSYKGIDVEIDKSSQKQNALAMLESLAALKNDNSDNTQKAKALQAIFEK